MTREQKEWEDMVNATAEEDKEHILQRGKALCGIKMDFMRADARGIDISRCVNNPCVDPIEGTCPKCYKIFLKRGVQVTLGGRR